MVVVITYDENGGFWDHVAPPKGDRFGPGTRVPTLIISPFARHGLVDHTLYDTTSILRLITRRFGLPELAGLKARDAAMAEGRRAETRRSHAGAGSDGEVKLFRCRAPSCNRNACLRMSWPSPDLIGD